MITGTHALFYSRNADELRAFFRDTLGFAAENEEGGWPTFTLPPAEVAVHPSDEDSGFELYLLCDDIEATVSELKAKGVQFSQPVSDQGWGLLTSVSLPGGGELGLYQPTEYGEKPED
jgi:catechol 2,3-dioxygenase-like lactoylglutathione lyase family enzyme